MTTRAEPWTALDRLMSAVAKVDPDALAQAERAEYVEARELAAKALLRNRVEAGLPWHAPAEGGFFERWTWLAGFRPVPTGGKR